jgi:hypothetical protein
MITTKAVMDSAALAHRSAWLDHDGPLPIIEGTLIRLQVGHLPGDPAPSRCGCGFPH